MCRYRALLIQNPCLNPRIKWLSIFGEQYTHPSSWLCCLHLSWGSYLHSLAVVGRQNAHLRSQPSLLTLSPASPSLPKSKQIFFTPVPFTAAFKPQSNSELQGAVNACSQPSHIPSLMVFDLDGIQQTRIFCTYSMPIYFHVCYINTLYIGDIQIASGRLQRSIC